MQINNYFSHLANILKKWPLQTTEILFSQLLSAADSNSKNTAL